MRFLIGKKYWDFKTCRKRCSIKQFNYSLMDGIAQFYVLFSSSRKLIAYFWSFFIIIIIYFQETETSRILPAFTSNLQVASPGIINFDNGEDNNIVSDITPQIAENDHQNSSNHNSAEKNDKKEYKTPVIQKNISKLVQLRKASTPRLGKIHILRKHLYSTKISLNSKIFTKTGFFVKTSQNKRISFSTLHFDEIFTLKFEF